MELGKIFIYKDSSFDDSIIDNLFVSGSIYKNVAKFKRDNPEFTPVMSFNVDDFDLIKKLKEENEKLKEFVNMVSFHGCCSGNCTHDNLTQCLSELVGLALDADDCLEEINKDEK
jgi:hypothetical protein